MPHAHFIVCKMCHAQFVSSSSYIIHNQSRTIGVSYGRCVTVEMSHAEFIIYKSIMHKLSLTIVHYTQYFSCDRCFMHKSGYEDALVLRWPAFGCSRWGCAEWVGGVLLASDSRRSCGSSSSREHISARRMLLLASDSRRSCGCSLGMDHIWLLQKGV